MTILDERPIYAPRLHRRHEIVTTGGLDGVLQVSSILADHAVREFVADVREGVVYGTVTCTVSLTEDECRHLVDRLLAAPRVTSVSPC
ncbi:MAG: hypothetical protein AB7J32_15280 [Pseudonocardia sp.]